MAARDLLLRLNPRLTRRECICRLPEMSTGGQRSAESPSPLIACVLAIQALPGSGGRRSLRPNGWDLVMRERGGRHGRSATSDFETSWTRLSDLLARKNVFFSRSLHASWSENPRTHHRNRQETMPGSGRGIILTRVYTRRGTAGYGSKEERGRAG